MIGPGGAAQNAASNGGLADAQVWALLALAYAVNRLAEAHEQLAGSC